MKFTRLMSTTYDAGTKTLKFSGQTGDGETAEVEMPLQDENVFLAAMAARLYDGKQPPAGTGKTIVAQQLKARFSRSKSGKRAIAFTVRSGSLHLHYVLPIQTSDPSKIAEIQAHMKAMFALLGEREMRVTH